MSGHKIMVVDDNAATRRMVKNALTRHGYEVLEAPDGATARALARGADESHADAAALTLLATESGGDALITARMSPRCGARSGQPLRIVLDAERMYFFDAETENAIGT